MMKRLLKRLKQSSKKTSRNKPAQVAKANHAATGDVSYVKLTIEGNDDFIGKRFKLFYAGKLIWGTEIERAPRGYELEYRNIIVSKKPEQISESKFEIQPKLPIKIEVSDHQFTTPEQDTYDQRFDVRKHGDFWYSMRGNTKKPKKIILTFAGFGPSTTRIPYSVSYISGIGEEDLSNAMLIAFQDRYQVAGDYMIENDRAEALYPKFCSLISGLLKKYQLTDQDLLFFGASKGGGIALRYAEKFPQARLVLAVPQVQLLYYWQSKAFFRNNLFNAFRHKKIADNLELLKQYLGENRDIYYFYTNNDELSNYSFIEVANGFPNLHKFRVAGVHGSVTKKALPTILSVMRQFLQSNSVPTKAKDVVDMVQLSQDDKSGFQVELPEEFLTYEGEFNAFLTSSSTKENLNYALTQQEIRSFNYTNPEEMLSGEYDWIDGVDQCTVYLDNGERRLFKLQRNSVYSNAPIETSMKFKAVQDNTLQIRSGLTSTYEVIEEDRVDAYSIRFDSITSADRTLHVRLADQMPQPPVKQPAGATVVITSQTGEFRNLAILLSRVVKKLNMIKLRIVVENIDDKDAVLSQLFALDLLDTIVVMEDPVLTDTDVERLPLGDTLHQMDRWYADGKFSCKFAHPLKPQNMFALYQKSALSLVK